MSEIVFWISCSGIVYAYFGYPVLLGMIKAFRGRKGNTGADSPEHAPIVSLIIPAHNEETAIEAKLLNTIYLDYPRERLEIIVVSDGSTDATNSIVRKVQDDRVTFIELQARGGKAQALNAGLARSRGDVVVFSDASILLEPAALRSIVRGFRDETVGCVSGEDKIRDKGGEGIYGRYELYLRNQESAVRSIVGASGSFYAQRRSLCLPFREGMAPDFLSVLTTVEKGYRAVTEPAAVGYMSSLRGAKGEFARKERTVLRGMTTLFHKAGLLNPFRYGLFSLLLISHKVMRWMVPFLLVLVFVANLRLLDDGFFAGVFIAQCAFYLLAGISLLRGVTERFPVFRIPQFFCLSNLAILTAGMRYLLGARQELWSPTKR